MSCDVELRTVRELCTDETYQDVLCPPVPPERVLEVRSVFSYDADNAPTYQKLIVARGTTRFLLDHYEPGTGTKMKLFQGRYYVPEGCQIGVRFGGATATDGLEVTINGLWLA